MGDLSMLKTLRFAVIAEADRHTHYLYPSGRLERVVKGQLQHGSIGVVGNLLTGQQVTIINRLCNQAQRENPRVLIRREFW
jgi:hypothetical protein